MKVHLAGHNSDYQELQKLIASSDSKAVLTPETLSAAYARISRSPKPVNELRKEACKDVYKSRKSNENIVFEMGHSSIAEHAVFNFDILNISRLAVEELEHFRLASFTEKSQRYVTLDNDYVIPKEIQNDAEILALYKETVAGQFDFYQKLFEKLKVYFYAKDPKTAEYFAKEDARYILPLAMDAQLGMTLNCRSLEAMLRKFASSSLLEVKELGEMLYDKVKDIVPSLIRYHSKTDYNSDKFKDLAEYIPIEDKFFSYINNDQVKLVDYTKDIDNKIITSIIHSKEGFAYPLLYNRVKRLSKDKKKEIFKRTFKYIHSYDKVLREFEFANFTFELIISSSCFAQLKRHRIATLTKQNYDPVLGITKPESVKAIGMGEEYLAKIKKINHVFETIKAKYNHETAEYILTNSHKRRALFQINLRELYHISRLREDAHAQWDIRDVTYEMVQLAKKQAPMALMLAGGKHEFQKKYQEVYSIKN